ncbi:hypothetical protein A0H81_14656 [Grifola frondosa]|uniref:Uncharacterized protein n=1 Tax=Grifola frondosa TaxID=5627 RepID=A0A1C7LLD5_GRIFR|nr:hypothetical protein A0H81_14656 [Grifola frondosa]
MASLSYTRHARLIRAHTPRAPIVRPRTASLVPHAHSHLHPHFMLAPIPHCTPYLRDSSLRPGSSDPASSSCAWACRHLPWSP